MPLHYAKNSKIAELLINLGALSTVMDNKGNKPKFSSFEAASQTQFFKAKPKLHLNLDFTLNNTVDIKPLGSSSPKQ